MTADQNLLTLARNTLTEPELQVWIAKHIRNLGRRAGSLALGITEEAWRYRLNTATRKIEAAQTRKDAA